MPQFLVVLTYFFVAKDARAFEFCYPDFVTGHLILSRISGCSQCYKCEVLTLVSAVWGAARSPAVRAPPSTNLSSWTSN